MLKATAQLESDYDAIKDFLINGMKDTPNTQALSTYLFLTGSRIHEALPWRYTRKDGTITQKALLLDNLVISKISEEGVWAIVVPYVLKRKKISLKAKGERESRIILTRDKELMGILLNYINYQRPMWKGELLEKSYFNPKQRLYSNTLRTISAVRGVRGIPDQIYKRIKARVGKYRDKWYSHNEWLLTPTKNGDILADRLVFPFGKTTYLDVIRKMGYKIKGQLYDLRTGEFIKGSKRIYSHFFREARVNTMFYKDGFNLDEITYMMGWRSQDSIQYYHRRDEQMIVGSIDKLVAAIKGESKDINQNRVKQLYTLSEKAKTKS